jgi:dUTP pyrophosphatase
MTNNHFWNCEKYMDLIICVCSNDNDLRNRYILAAEKHNQKMSGNPFPDAGFDLFLPDDCVCKEGQPNRLNFQVKCRGTMICDNGKTFATGFYMYPRSSLSKTMLRLANSVGIIDSGYRGDVMGMFDCSMMSYLVYKYDKLVQICAPGLVPIYVKIVFDPADLGEETNRGDGGFGSTGR